MQTTLNFWSIFSLSIYLFNWILAIYFVIDLVFRRHNPVTTLSWSVVLLTLPYVGLILYLYFGRNFRKKKIYSRKGLHDEKLKKELSSRQLHYLEGKEPLPDELEEQKKLVRLCLNNSKSIITIHNDTQLFFTGRSALNDMYETASKASNHIHLQSFILENDSLGTRWKNLLIQKAREGVDVRVIYDDFGSWHLPRSYIKALRKEGVQIEAFGKVNFPGFKAMINYRNHRKLLIVDGQVGYLGGVNIADRYYDGGTSLQWRDTHLRIRGEAVSQLQSSFLMDWYFITHKNVRMRKREAISLPQTPPASDPNICYMQIVSSGPDSDWADIMQLYMTLVTQAKRKICLISPYLIPNESILNALRTAALGGVDVRILIPEKGDSKFVHYASLSYVSELLEAGVKIYLFTKGFIHSKVLSIDGDCCLIGSANMDNRSLEHHFEIGAMIYNADVSQQIEKQFSMDVKDSRLILARLWEKRPMGEKIWEGIARLLSPLL